MSPELTWSHPEDDDLHSNKYGNIVNHGAWNHLFIAIKLKQQTDTKGVYEVSSPHTATSTGCNLT